MAAAVYMLAFPAWTLAAPADDALFDLSLDELLDLEVTSVSKKSQPISAAAAAVFVITGDDIRRSGVTTVPDALRMAPGVQVAQVDANKWAISARGFSGRFSNKLLVLMDGRSLYTPLFSGVFWDAQDVMLEDIERIEVIRGPGSTLWGANAVNGVINIITKQAAETQGTLVSAGLGDEERGSASLRFGDRLGDLGHYRVYARYFDRDGGRLAETGDDAGDDWHQGRAGFRADLALDSDTELTIQGDAYRGDSGETMATPTLTPPSYVEVADRNQAFSGFNLLARWSQRLANQDQLTLQGYFDSTRREQAFLEEDRYTFDLDFDYRTLRFPGHDLLFGLGYRRTVDDIGNSALISLVPDSTAGELFSAFVQDDITLVPDRWSLILGSKFEHNDATGLEFQPNARLLWTPDERRSLWASVTRSVRTPGRIDQHLRMLNSVLPPGTAINPTPVPSAVYLQADADNGSEVLMAYEAGFKFQADTHLAIDVAIFYSEYDNLRSFSAGPVRCEPVNTLPVPSCLFDPTTTNLVADATLGESGSGRSHGVELVADWRPRPTWRLQAAYSYLDVDTDAPAGARVVEEAQRNPRHQFSLRSGFNPRPDIDVDLWLRHMDDFAVSQIALGDHVEVGSYTELDARIAWRPNARAEIALVGRNLLDSSHMEFYSETSDLARVEVERSVHLQLRYRF
jgi:iron complex outermembrane recepter protein